VLLPEVRRRNLALTPDEQCRMLPLGPRSRRVLDLLAEPVLGIPPFARTEEALLIDKLLLEEIAKEPIGEAELRQAYTDAQPAELVVPASYRARRIVVRRLPTDVGPATYVRLESLRRELSKAGADFAAAARRESIGPEADAGGLLPEVTPGTAEPLQLDALRELGPGQISHPICRGFRCEILKLEQVTPARRKTFEEARSELLDRLRLVSGKERVRRWVAAQERAAGVEIYVTGARR
jgi:parvulin-like peptidyl-prolyl isomerase